jgi:hypothetical protein
VKIAFSKPTRDDAEQRELFNGFRSAGYAGLQLKGNNTASSSPTRPVSPAAGVATRPCPAA